MSAIVEPTAGDGDDGICMDDVREVLRRLADGRSSSCLSSSLGKEALGLCDAGVDRLEASGDGAVGVESAGPSLFMNFMARRRDVADRCGGVAFGDWGGAMALYSGDGTGHGRDDARAVGVYGRNGHSGVSQAHRDKITLAKSVTSKYVVVKSTSEISRNLLSIIALTKRLGVSIYR